MVLVLNSSEIFEMSGFSLRKWAVGGPETLDTSEASALFLPLFNSHCSLCSNSRDDEKIVLNELLPMLACLNSSGAGVSLF